MPRTVTDARLDSRAARGRLPVGPKPHWRTLTPGLLHLGYRRKSKDVPGTWLARRYRGGERYAVASLGLADDVLEGGGTPYAEAVRAAYALRFDAAPRTRRTAGALTVEDAFALTSPGWRRTGAVLRMPRFGPTR